MGFTFTLENGVVRYTHDGARPDPEKVRRLLHQLRENRAAACRFLEQRDQAIRPEPEEAPTTDRSVKIQFPADAQVLVISGCWRRLESGEIEATYPSYELVLYALTPTVDARRRELEERLARTVDAVQKHEGCDEELKRLQARLADLLENHQETLDQLRLLRVVAAESVANAHSRKAKPNPRGAAPD
jgi:hypothetical protein